MTLTRVLRRALLVALMLPTIMACSRDVPTVEIGGISLNVSSSASVAAVTLWRVTITGQGAPQERTGSPGERIEFPSLAPGSYTVLLQGFEGADLASSGQTTVMVQSGQTATASVSLAPVLPTLTVFANDPSAAEAEAPANPGAFRIIRSGSTSSALVVNLTIAGTATGGTDYTTIAPTITMAVGQREFPVVVTPRLDAVEEGSETVRITVSSGSGYTVGSPDSATVTLADAPIVTVTSPDADASEAGSNTGTFRITRSGETTASLGVNLTMTGTAVSGTDYQNIATRQTIPAGAASVDVPLTPVPDTEAEGSETAILTVVAGTGYAVGAPASASATVTVSDTPLPTVTVTALDAEASEVGPNNGTFRIARTGATTGALAVRVTLTGRAANTLDYQTISETQTIPVDSGSFDVRLVPVSDAVIEGVEDAILSVVAGPGYVLGASTSATVAIADTPLPSIVLTPSSRSFVASQGGPSPASQTVTVTNGGGGTLTGLSVGAISYGGPQGWLSASLDASTAPTTLRLQPTVGSLPQGTYTATVPVLSAFAGNGSQSVSVTLAVSSPADVLYALYNNRLISLDRETGALLTNRPLVPAQSGLANALCSEGTNLFSFVTDGGFYNLVRIVAETGEVTVVGRTADAGPNMSCAVNRATGVLYILRLNRLFTVDKATGVSTQVGSLTAGLVYDGGSLAISARGDAFISARTVVRGRVEPCLFSVSLATGSISIAGFMDNTISEIFHSSIDSAGSLWAVEGFNILKTINTTTAVTQNRSTLFDRIQGMAFSY